MGLLWVAQSGHVLQLLAEPGHRRGAEHALQPAFLGCMKSAGGGERVAATFGQPEPPHPAVARIGSSLHVVSGLHFTKDLRHPLVADPKAPSELPLTGLVLREHAEDVSEGPAQIGEAAPRQIGTQPLREALIREAQEDPKIESVDVFNHG